MTPLGEAIDGMDHQARDQCLEDVAEAIMGRDPAVIVLVCLYFALRAVPLLGGDTDELLDDLPRLGRALRDSHLAGMTRQ